MTLQQLYERLGAIRDEAQAIVDAADNDNSGEMTEEQQQQFDALMAEKEKVNETIKRKEQLESMDQGQGRKTQPTQPATPYVEVSHGIEEDPMCGFKSSAELGRAVKQACLPGGDVDDRLKVLGAPSNFHRETSSTDGYMVPPAIRQEVWNLVFTDEGLLSAMNPEPTESNSVQLYVDEETPWSNGGIQANWASEGNQFSPSRLSTQARNVQLNKLYAFVLATEELLNDAPRLQNRLTVQAAQAIRFKADSALVNGDGVGKPEGWMQSGSLITVAKEGSQSADTLVAENVLKMYARLLETRVAGAFWLTNRNTMPQLATMTIGDQPIWTPPNTGLRNAPGGVLLGLPVRFSEHAETLGDKGDIQLIAPEGYYATNKAGGIDFAASMHLYFDYDIEAFRWTFRLGGQPYLSAPISANKGDSKSHFVTLAERT